MKTIDFLDAVKARHKLTSDYQLGKFLRWTAQRISTYRAGRRELDDDACVQIAEALDLPGAYVICSIGAARAKSSEAKREWQKAAKLILKYGTAAMLAATLQLVSAPPAKPGEPSASSVYSVKRRLRRGVVIPLYPRRLRRLAA